MTDKTPPFDSIFNEQKTKVSIALPSAQFEMTAIEIEEAIRWLGAVRANMNPTIPIEPVPEQNYFVADSCFFARHESNEVPAIGGGHILLRSNLLGWIRFVASPEFLRRFSAWVDERPMDSVPKEKLN